MNRPIQQALSAASLFVLVFAASALAANPVDSQAVTAGVNGLIVFSRGGIIYAVDADGASERALTNSTYKASLPRWSPDGTKIVFGSGSGLYTMNANGTQITKIADGHGILYGQAQWSPDSTKIAFTGIASRYWSIYVISPDGTNIKRLTGDDNFDSMPRWSADGTKIAFSRAGEDNSTQYMINVDGTGLEELSDDTHFIDFQTLSPDGKKVVFASTMDDYYSEIYVMNMDGTDIMRLTQNHFISDTNPAWSPDGTKILFARENSLYIMDTDGTDVKKIIDGHIYAHMQPFQSAGADAKVAFTRMRSNGHTGIYLMNPDSSNQAILAIDNLSDSSQPEWSPDGSKVAFVNNSDGNLDIHIVDSDGENWERLIGLDSDDAEPSWSPDGDKIVYTISKGSYKRMSIMHPNGTSLGPFVADANARDSYPDWSVNDEIAFSRSVKGGDQDIYVVKANGMNLTRLTDDTSDDIHPAWSPDGSRIAFATNRTGDYEVYVMGADGSDQRNLTNNPARDDYFPTWSPDGSKILFVAAGEGEDTEIYSMDFDGTDLEELTSNRYDDTEPSFGVLYHPPPDVEEPEISDIIKLGPPQIGPAGASPDGEPSVGDQLVITASAENTAEAEQPLFVTIVIKDADGLVQYAAWQSGTVKAGSTLNVSVTWTPARAGTYHLTISALAGPENQESVASGEITIA